jgi:hypothetical protein
MAAIGVACDDEEELVGVAVTVLNHSVGSRVWTPLLASIVERVIVADVVVVVGVEVRVEVRSVVLEVAGNEVVESLSGSVGQTPSFWHGSPSQQPNHWGVVRRHSYHFFVSPQYGSPRDIAVFVIK